jgi:ATP/maltotriose-dependent transcriptional regulator MalT
LLCNNLVTPLISPYTSASAPGCKIKKGEIPSTTGLLTGRELEVLHLMADGFSNPQIAKKLIVSPDTAKTHGYHILDKLEAGSRVQAIVRAKDLNLP